jgi:hypothetical protein
MTRRFRALVEHYRTVEPGKVSCPHCGAMLPCGDNDQPVRMSHYARCTGKPQPIEVIAKPMILGDIDYPSMTDEQLRSLRLSMELRLKSFETPLIGVHAILHPAYKNMHDAASDELSRREGGL